MMKAEDKKVTLTISISPEQFDQLTRLAVTRGVNRSKVVCQIIEDYYKSIKL